MKQKPVRRQSARSARTRSALIAAGFELLVERPIDAIPIDDVVAQAGVAKGSFFNHFSDKQDYAKAVGIEVRVQLEKLVSRANAGVDNPVERIAGGMRVAAEFAVSQPKRSAALLRGEGASTALHHPLNEGLRSDIDAACAQDLLPPEAKSAGVLYWLGLCQALMSELTNNPKPAVGHEALLREMLTLGLRGLGVGERLRQDIVGENRGQ